MIDLTPYIKEIFVALGWVLSLIVQWTRMKVKLVTIRKDVRELESLVRRLEVEFRKKIGKLDEELDKHHTEIAVITRGQTDYVDTNNTARNTLQDEIALIRTRFHAQNEANHRAIIELSSHVNKILGILSKE